MPKDYEAFPCYHIMDVSFLGYSSVAGSKGGADQKVHFQNGVRQTSYPKVGQTRYSIALLV